MLLCSYKSQSTRGGYWLRTWQRSGDWTRILFCYTKQKSTPPTDLVCGTFSSRLHSEWRSHYVKITAAEVAVFFPIFRCQIERERILKYLFLYQTMRPLSLFFTAFIAAEWTGRPHTRARAWQNNHTSTLSSALQFFTFKLFLESQINPTLFLVG